MKWNRDVRELRDRVAFVGVGTSEYGPPPTIGNERLMARAFQAALAEAGLTKADVDGIALNIGSPLGLDYDQLIDVLGLHVNYADQTWQHGRIMTNLVINAALALSAGLVNVVAIMACVNWQADELVGALGTQQDRRVSGGAHHEHPHFGLTSPGGAAAMSTRNYLSRFGGSPDDLATIALTMRRNAQRNPAAVMHGRELTREAYLASPFICEPLRRLDYCLVRGGAVCLLLTRADRAKDGPTRPVYLAGMQPQGGRRGTETTSLSYYLDWHGANPDEASPPRDDQVYRMAGLGPRDVGAFYYYDAFSSALLWTLERFSFCPTGEALGWIQGGRIDLDGELPVNSNGGLLSEVHVSGWNHLAEMVRQLRGECGERQIANLQTAMWAVGSSALLLRN